jgi:hypothetical protein
MKQGRFLIPPISDEEEARIQELIASDPDAPEATDEQLSRAKPFAEAHPDLMESIRRERNSERNAHEKVTH